MHSDDDLQTTLSKWPFILGDVLLVATALVIGMLGDWQISYMEIAFCVVAVALGAGLFVLPYIVEFKVRVREEADDRAADLRVLQRQVVSAQDQLEAVTERIESIEEGLGQLAQIQPPDVTAPIQAIEDKIDPLIQQQAEQSAQLKALAQQMETLAKSFESKVDANTIEALQSELTDLKTKIEEMPARFPVAGKAPRPEAAPVQEVEKIDPSEPVEVNPVEPIAKKTRAPHQRRTPEPRLLQRAIEQKQDKSSEAVSRIIESKSKKPSPENPTPTPEPEVKEPKESEEPEEPKESEEPKEPADMFGKVVPVNVKKRVRTKKSDTAVVASVFIGIGNKPYVRGSGAGLNWDTGIAMEFEEIGKWRWIAPADLEEPVELQLFRNDEDADSTGKYKLEPGQQLDLSPVF